MLEKLGINIDSDKIKQALDLIKEGKQVYESLEAIAEEDPKAWEKVSKAYKDSYGDLINAIEKKKAK